MPDKSVLGTGHATKRRFAELIDDDDDSDCEIIEVKPAKRTRADSSVPLIFGNFFKRIGDWFKRTHRTNTHLFGAAAESNSAADAIAHGGQYLEEASKDKFMPRHENNGNGKPKAGYPSQHMLDSGSSQRAALAGGLYTNGDEQYLDNSAGRTSTRSKFESKSYPQSTGTQAQISSSHGMVPSTSSMYSFSQPNDNVAEGYKHHTISGYGHDPSGSTEEMNGSMQRSYIKDAVKHRQATSKSTVYDRSFSGTGSPPLITTINRRSSTKKSSTVFDLEEKERYKVLLKQYALRVDSSSQPQPVFNTEHISMSKLSTNPSAVNIPPFGLLREEGSTDKPTTKISQISPVHDDSLELPPSDRFKQPQSTPLHSRKPKARRPLTVNGPPLQPSAMTVRCDKLVQKMQDLKERSLNRLAEQRALKAEELKLTEWENLRAQEDNHLEEMVKQRLKLSAKIILDDLPTPEEEPYDEFPELTDEAEITIAEAWQRGPNNILSDAFRIRITRSDMATLASSNWLNDEVVNFYFNLIQDRGGKDNYPSVYVFNTFFYPKIMKDGHKGVARWTKKVDIFSKDLILIPVHLGMHWCLACINLKDKSIQYFDSMGGKNQSCLDALRRYLQDERIDKKKEKFDTSNWVLESVRDIPQQMNGSDCGVFTCKYAEYLSRNARFTFSQAHMPYFRKRMVYEILKKKLL
ncbi:uncharacterized protein [Watersipora subatra]|uniref:uncharacterized protein isoform X2 n=1 Tax=Watersipora subatra TaxID=2589382 RepID=UPI00355C26BC